MYIYMYVCMYTVIYKNTAATAESHPTCTTFDILEDQLLSCIEGLHLSNATDIEPSNVLRVMGNM